jgi:hypothetical protein
MEKLMGDKSPKSKRRDQKQKGVAKAEGAAAARRKQDPEGPAGGAPAKGKGNRR